MQSQSTGSPSNSNYRQGRSVRKFGTRTGHLRIWKNFSPLVLPSDFQQENQTVDKVFSVVEYSSFFAVRHVPSGDEHPMGDGVDTLFDEEGRALSPGTPDFVQAWENALNADEGGTLEAYFPEHLED